MDNHNCARIETTGDEPVAIDGVSVSGEINGLLLDVKMEQRFHNPTKKNVEIVYTFPLPWRAVLLGVDVVLGDKKLSGMVVEKAQAETSYEEAMSDGDAAIMLEKNHDETYTLNLGNINAQEHCVITLRYAQVLNYVKNALRIVIPTVIAPRYGDAVADGGLSHHQATEHSIEVEYPFVITMQIHGQLATARVGSPSHPISVINTANTISISLASNSFLDRDFVLNIDQIKQTSIAMCANESVLPEHFVAIASFSPQIGKDESDSQPVVVKLLVDCSGSMAGDSINAAKNALSAIIETFDKADRFSLSRFGSTTEHRSRGLWNVTEISRKAAIDWVSQLEANLGGTEMETALISTFAIAAKAPSDVLLITDGQIEAINSTIDAAKKSGDRVFVVGIGSSSAETHLRRLAEVTGGACEFVTAGEAVESAVRRMYARLRSHRMMSDVKVIWPDNAQPVWVSDIASYVYDGDTVNAFALFKKQPEGLVELVAVDAKHPKPFVIGSAHFEYSHAQLTSESLSRVAANTRLRSISAVASNTELAASLAVDYQIITDKTNFLLVYVRDADEKAKDMPELMKVKQMLPAGWAGIGTVDHYMPTVLRKRSAGYGMISGIDYCCSIDLVPSAVMHDEFSDHGLDVMSPEAAALQMMGIDSDNWPVTYRGLINIGIEEFIVMWLGDHLGHQYSEQEIVTAFLYVLTQCDIFESLLQGVEHSVINEIIKANLHQEVRLINEGAVVAIVLSLDGMTINRWPGNVMKISLSPPGNMR